MPRAPQAPPPGVVRLATPFATAGRWWDTNNIRWRQGLLQPTGGSIAYPGAVFDASPPRDVLNWHDNNGAQWCAVGTDNKLWAFNYTTQTLYDITPTGVGPLDPPGATLGFGTGPYGAKAYGTARDPSDVSPADIGAALGDMWSMDNFGEDLYFVPTQDGHLFVWHPATPTTAPAIVAGAPVSNKYVLVSDQRHIVLLGAAGDPRRVQWSDQENPTQWTPLINNLAGSKQLVTQGVALCGLKVSDGILIWTTNDVHKMVYVGTPYAYGITEAGSGCGPISQRAPTKIAGRVAWPGAQTFWQYAGTTQPFNCDVGDWFYSLVNRTMAGRIFGTPNPAFQEIWWDWPDEGATECNRYLILMYAGAGMMAGGGGGQNIWAIGQRQRTGGDRVGTMDRPLLGGVDALGVGVLYMHEFGWTDDLTPRLANTYAESGDIVLGNADFRYDVQQVAFDLEPDPGLIGYRFFTREQANGSEDDTGLYTVIHDGLMDVRFSTRHCRMRLEALADEPFALGRPQLEIKQRGKR